ncbi:hypothetical protein C8F04DRAFT_1198185 [Mycena alexandri]|uniref:Uncharacterized protein n=1 Tax=Mycena alexandri TaxID=1745969 RepID=A0AAD6S0L0_9AGAR|nr:hypothetical protein C8F04DRAFT_1198185 [Mycena alexandri]
MRGPQDHPDYACTHRTDTFFARPYAAPPTAKLLCSKKGEKNRKKKGGGGKQAHRLAPTPAQSTFFCGKDTSVDHSPCGMLSARSSSLEYAAHPHLRNARPTRSALGRSKSKARRARLPLCVYAHTNRSSAKSRTCKRPRCTSASPDTPRAAYLLAQDKTQSPRRAIPHTHYCRHRGRTAHPDPAPAAQTPQRRWSTRRRTMGQIQPSEWDGARTIYIAQALRVPFPLCSATEKKKKKIGIEK